VLPEDQSLQSTLRRGWYWGLEQFREFLLKKVDAAAIGVTATIKAHRWVDIMCKQKSRE
jgi:hypothetical protein